MSQLLLVVVVIAIAGLALWVCLEVTIIYPPMVGLLYREGRFQRELPPGRHSWFDPLKRTRVVQVLVAERAVSLPEMTVLSKDRFSFRLTLSPALAVTDARVYSESQQSLDTPSLGYFLGGGGVHPALYPSVAAATLEAASERTLAEILASPAALTADVLARIESAVPGATVARLLLTAVNLPPETRKMFTDVERAKMEAQGALERARGEQAALRVLANAARLVSDNPALANLRLLQAIEATKGSTTIILGESAVAPAGFATRPAARPAP
jgi:regulator of protease activity HflC (stomatin/prohibitin superfamily)